MISSNLFSNWDEELYFKVKRFLLKRISRSQTETILNILTGDDTHVLED